MDDFSKQQRRIYEQLATTNKALESTSDAIIVADNIGVAIYVNPAFVNLFGYTINELNLAGIPNILFEKPIVGEGIFTIVRREGSWSGETDLKTRDGRVIPFVLNVDHIYNDQREPIGFISICTNITQQKLLSQIQLEQRILAETQLDALRILTSTLDLHEVFWRILENIKNVVRNDAASIILIQDGNVQLVDREDYSDKAGLDELKSGEMPVHHYDDLKLILSTGIPLVIPDTKIYLQDHPEIKVHTPWLNSHIGIPIHLHDEVIGFLNVDSIQPGMFTHEHAFRLALFAEQAAIAIHNARLHEQAQKLARIEEQQRLARNLHDSVSQTLFSASLIADALPGLWQIRPEEVLSRLEQIQQLNRSALAEMRTLLLELHPERLLETEINELLRQFAIGILGQTRLDVKLDLDDELNLPPDLHVAVYYITQEALNNVVKHAGASQVTVKLRRKHDAVRLWISDNGCGFDLDQVASTSLGLDIIRERAQQTKAKLEIVTEIGQGTEIAVNWPA